jgi:hypothetical protein
MPIQFFHTLPRRMNRPARLPRRPLTTDRAEGGFTSSVEAVETHRAAGENAALGLGRGALQPLPLCYSNKRSVGPLRRALNDRGRAVCLSQCQFAISVCRHRRAARAGPGNWRPTVTYRSVRNPAPTQSNGHLRTGSHDLGQIDRYAVAVGNRMHQRTSQVHEPAAETFCFAASPC